jgi:hypothetical protein
MISSGSLLVHLAAIGTIVFLGPLSQGAGEPGKQVPTILEKNTKSGDKTRSRGQPMEVHPMALTQWHSNSADDNRFGSKAKPENEGNPDHHWNAWRPVRGLRHRPALSNTDGEQFEHGLRWSEYCREHLSGVPGANRVPRMLWPGLPEATDQVNVSRGDFMAASALRIPAIQRTWHGA